MLQTLIDLFSLQLLLLALSDVFGEVATAGSSIEVLGPTFASLRLCIFLPGLNLNHVQYAPRLSLIHI